jgi:hypothetical protein
MASCWPVARDGAGGAGLLSRDVGVHQRIHAGVLHGGEEAQDEGLADDLPDRRVRAYGRERQDHQADHDRVATSTLR